MNKEPTIWDVLKLLNRFEASVVKRNPEYKDMELFEIIQQEVDKKIEKIDRYEKMKGI
jgi:hypothetical protein